jgi:hypothetical protein
LGPSNERHGSYGLSEEMDITKQLKEKGDSSVIWCLPGIQGEREGIAENGSQCQAESTKMRRATSCKGVGTKTFQR